MILACRNRHDLARLLRSARYNIREGDQYGTLLFSRLSTVEIYTPLVVCFSGRKGVRLRLTAWADKFVWTLAAIPADRYLIRAVLAFNQAESFDLESFPEASDIIIEYVSSSVAVISQPFF